MTKHVLITGGAGFIGYHLGKRLLAEGYRVDLLDSFSRGVRDEAFTELANSDGVELLDVDLLKPGALDDAATDYDHIIHLAAIIGVVHVQQRPYEVLRDNVAMLDQVIALARRQSNLSRLVFASTSEVYAGTLTYFDLPVPTPESTPIALSDLAQPRTSYMLSKLYGEAMCRNSGVPFTIVRPHNVYGPRMGLVHVVPELLQRSYKAADGDTLDVFSVDHRRSFCYIDDAVEIMVRLMERPDCAGQVMNLGRQDPEVTIREVAETCIAATGKSLEIDPKPATPGSPARRAPDMSATTALVDFEAQVDLREGVQRTFDWYRTNIFSGSTVSAR